MRRLFTYALLLLLGSTAIRAGRERVVADAWTRVAINGQVVPVSFNDGDSFRVQSGEYSGSQCRLSGFNTLESFGPAHQWGDWHPYELFVNAKMALRNARTGAWHCFTDGRRDGYGRLLMDCPDLAVSHIRQGFAMGYMVDDHPSRPEYIRAQQEAIAARRGMWAHGVPDYVMTSVHSFTEDVGRDEHYNRLISTHDGHSESYGHRDWYSTCEWVCNNELRADETAVSRAALALRADTRLAPLLEPWQNFHLEEFARRYARLGVVPEYLDGPAREPVTERLGAMARAGQLGTTHIERGACMIEVQFDRWYGRNRAGCLLGHGTQPNDSNTISLPAPVAARHVLAEEPATGDVYESSDSE
jgi:endonuclease YncB( thermonuclease family)